MKKNLKKNQFTQNFLIADVEKPFDINVNTTPTTLQITVFDLLKSVCIYNSGKKIGTDWRTHIEETTNLNWIRSNFNCGFSGSHFWLHDNQNERVLIITFQKVIIDPSLDQTED